MINEPARRPLRVLIVDDNRDAADSLACYLQLNRFEVRVAYDGLAGLVGAHEFTPDCLVSDINMPAMDGYALAARVRRSPELAGVKLVALSAFSDERHARRSAEVGFDYQLTKAGDPAELLEVLRMIEDVKTLARETRMLARQNVELAGEAKELLEEVKEEVREVKQEVRELKKEMKELREDRGIGREEGEPNSRS